MERIKSVVIVGGGTAGWMTAAALSRYLTDDYCTIRLIESELLGTVGVGEATIPAILDFNRRLGLDERDFMRATNATYKLGIEFVDWARIGDAYLHPFGYYGRDMNGVAFHQYWLKLRQAGDSTPLDEYSLPYMAAKGGKFRHPDTDARSVFSTYSYAFHLDAALYARYLRGYAENRGVRRTEGRIIDVTLRGSDGYVDSVLLESGERIGGDLFIDCSGFRGLLIEDALGTGYESWEQWLPCDRAVAIQSEHVGDPLPHTRATALAAGWQWRIPLQHRTGNGHVYSSRYLSDDEAIATALDNIEGAAIAEPRILRFCAGKRRKMWNRNCVAIGLSGGFLEPLESTSIYLIQAAIMKLLEFFPDREAAAVDVDEFNSRMSLMFDQIRDFIILHYKATARDDTPFWNDCREMQIPDELQYRMRQFDDRGHVVYSSRELFVETNWVAIYLGQRLFPPRYDPRVDCLGAHDIEQRLQQMKSAIARAAASMPAHAEALRALSAAPPHPTSG
jgi:tryptophan halogenase